VKTKCDLDFIFLVWQRVYAACWLYFPFSLIVQIYFYDIHLHHIWGIESSLQTLMLCEDDKIRDMASKMSKEFDKYLSEYSMILAFGCVLNPFLKFEFLEYLYDRLGHDTETVKAKVNNVRKAINALFNEYSNKSASTSSSLSVVDPPSTSTRQMMPDKFMIEYRVSVSIFRTLDLVVFLLEYLSSL
jgi:hypothetical protein